MFGWAAKARNQDGGPKTSVFAFSLERERETAARLTPPASPQLLNARLRLINEVHAYRLSGLLTDALLQACVDELELAPRNRPWLNVISTGMKRLCELAKDGHKGAAAIVRKEFAHDRAERRVTAYENACAIWLNKAERIAICHAMLEDPSSDVRQTGASQAERDGFYELADLLDRAAETAKGQRAKSNILLSVFFLRERHRLGLAPDARLPDESYDRRP